MSGLPCSLSFFICRRSLEEPLRNSAALPRRRQRHQMEGAWIPESPPGEKPPRRTIHLGQLNEQGKFIVFSH